MTKTNETKEGAGHPERISVHELPLFPDHIGRYRFALQWVPGCRVLDLCCGTGYGSFLMAAAGAASVKGVDIASEAVAEGQARGSLNNLSFEVQDALQLSFHRAFDLITCFEGLEHVSDPERLVANTARALDPEGTLIISTPNGAAQEGGHSGNPFHVKEMTPDEFRAVLSRHFTEFKLYYQRRNDPLDEAWSLGRALRPILRGLIPAGLRGRTSTPAATSGSPAPAADAAQTARAAAEYSRPDVRDRYYPKPWSYLGYPGMEPGYEPPIILAVCRGPRASGR